MRRWGIRLLDDPISFGSFSPDVSEGGLDLGFETGDEFAVGVDQRLLGFDLGRRAVRNGATSYFLFSRSVNPLQPQIARRTLGR